MGAKVTTFTSDLGGLVFVSQTEMTHVRSTEKLLLNPWNTPEKGNSKLERNFKITIPFNLPKGSVGFLRKKRPFNDKKQFFVEWCKQSNSETFK